MSRAGSSSRGQFRVKLSARRRWPAVWNGLLAPGSASLSLALKLDWWERVHEAGLAVVDGHFVVDVVVDDLVLALRWRESRRAGWRAPAITVARVVAGGTRLAWQPMTLRQVRFRDDEGDTVHGAGFDPPPESTVVKVAGVSFRSDALQSPTVAPLHRLAFVPEPSNPADPCAVGVWDEARVVHIGYVPREEAVWLLAAIGRGETWHGVSTWEWWRDDGRRIGVRMMLRRARPMAAQGACKLGQTVLDGGPRSGVSVDHQATKGD
jgi:hypothetical protein